MKLPLTALWKTLEVLEPREAGNLQILGLRWANSNGLPYITLDEALTADTLEISEVSQGGQVPDLKVVNKAEALVFLMAGEQLIGAKQNRILNASIMVPALAELTISVSCVERGRWGYRSSKFGSSGSPSHRRLRKLMSKQVSASYRETGKPSSRQGEVWREVDRKLAAMKSASSTDALAQTYEDHQKRLDVYRDRLKVPEGCHGVVFSFGGHIAGMDLFDKPSTLEKLWPKLVQGYAIDALEEPEIPAVAVAREAVVTWLQSLGQAKTESYKSLGLGDDIRMASKELVGAALVVDEHPVHVELYLNDEYGATT
jgi:hypothetical protein